MRKLIALFCFLSLQESQSAQSENILGYWRGPVTLTTEHNTRTATCSSLWLNLTQNERQEIKVHLNYDCIWGTDWGWSHRLNFATDKDGNLPGEDGYFKSGEFFWNNMDMRLRGSKLRFTVKDQNSLIVAIDEGDEFGGSNVRHLNGILTRQKNPMPEQKMIENDFAGIWQGTVEVRENGTRKKCDVNKWKVRHDNGVLWQTLFYISDCQGREIREYFGSLFFEYGKVFDYKSVDSSNLVEIGSYTPNLIKVKHREGYGYSDLEIKRLDENHVLIKKLYTLDGLDTEVILDLKKL